MDLDMNDVQEIFKSLQQQISDQALQIGVLKATIAKNTRASAEAETGKQPAPGDEA